MPELSTIQIVMGVVELLMLPLAIYIFKRIIGKRLDEFDEKRDRAVAEKRERMRKDEDWQVAMTAGMRSILRAEIVSEHRKWTEANYCPLETKEYLARCHAAYVGVGGNDIGDALFKEVIDLPNHPHNDNL